MFLFFLSCKDQGTKSEFTVVEKLNQGTIRQRGCNPCLPAGRLCRAPFLLLFLEKQKSIRQNLYSTAR